MGVNEITPNMIVSEELIREGSNQQYTYNAIISPMTNNLKQWKPCYMEVMVMVNGTGSSILLVDEETYSNLIKSDTKMLVQPRFDDSRKIVSAYFNQYRNPRS